MDIKTKWIISGLENLMTDSFFNIVTLTGILLFVNLQNNDKVF